MPLGFPVHLLCRVFNIFGFIMNARNFLSLGCERKPVNQDLHKLCGVPPWAYVGFGGTQTINSSIILYQIAVGDLCIRSLCVVSMWSCAGSGATLTIAASSMLYEGETGILCIWSPMNYVF